jgi:molybdate transport repressor ModE-like protein
MLDVRRMRILREVADRGSFSAAADALHLTQSAVSQQIAALERETGATLLERNHGRVRLTDPGRSLVSHADAVITRLEEAERELADIAHVRGGRLRVVSFPTAGATLVANAVP